MCVTRAARAGAIIISMVALVVSYEPSGKESPAQEGKGRDNFRVCHNMFALYTESLKSQDICIVNICESRNQRLIRDPIGLKKDHSFCAPGSKSPGNFAIPSFNAVYFPLATTNETGFPSTTVPNSQ